MLKTLEALKPRDIYLNRLIAFQDTEPVKVITGIRRCGKSSLLKLMQKHLLEAGIEARQIISVNFESMEYRDMDVQAFYNHVKEKVLPDKRMYLFFDEVQRLAGWEHAVNSFRVDFDCDIYITGSNAHLLSSELSTYLSGRYVEIKALPLSFREFLDFHGYQITERKTLTGQMKKRITDAEGEVYDCNGFSCNAWLAPWY
jgi:predicted AAA+ superfamily ATPase